VSSFANAKPILAKHQCSLNRWFFVLLGRIEANLYGVFEWVQSAGGLGRPVHGHKCPAIVCVCRPTYSHHASIVRIQMYVPNLMDPFCSPKSLCQYSYLNEKAAGRSADCVDWADKENDWDIGDSKPTWPPGQQQPGSLVQMLSGADACRSGFTAALWLQWCYKCFTECAVSFAAESESRGKAMQWLAEKASAPWVLPTRAWNFSRSSAKCKLCQILQSTCSRNIGPEVREKFLDQRAIWPVENQSTTTASFSSLSQLDWLLWLLWLKL